jgi:hypothetical protein
MTPVMCQTSSFGVRLVGPARKSAKESGASRSLLRSVREGGEEVLEQCASFGHDFNVGGRQNPTVI